MTGSIDGGKLAELFRELIVGRKSGLLFLRSEGAEKGIYLASGRIVNAESNLREESLGYRLLEEAILTPVGLEEALRQVEPGRTLRDVLVASGQVSEAVLDPILKALAEQVVIGSLELRHGTYFFQEGDFSFHGELPLDTPALLLEGVRRMFDFDHIRDRLLRDPRPLRQVGGQATLALEPAEGYIYSRADGSLAAADVCTLSLISEEMTCRVLYGLIAAGILGYGEAPPPPAAGAATAAPGFGSSAASSSYRPAATATVSTPVSTTASTSAAPAEATAERPSSGRSPMRPAGGERVSFRPSGPAGASSRASGASGASSPSSTSSFSSTPSGPSSAHQAPRQAGTARPANESPRSDQGARSQGGGSAGTAGRSGERSAGTSYPAAHQEKLKEIETLFDSLDKLNLYAILNLPRDVPTSAIDEAWQKLSARYHPGNNPWLTEPSDRSKLVFVFAKLRSAYETLHDDHRRLEYDEQLRKHDKDSSVEANVRLEYSKTDRQRALEERVRESEALYRESHKLFDMQRYHLAREKVLKAIQIHAEDPRFFALAGRIESLNPNMRWQKDAESHLRKAIELDPWKPEYRVFLGLLYRNAGMISKAKREFIRALELDATNETALDEVPPAERPVPKTTPTAPPPIDDPGEVEWT